MTPDPQTAIAVLLQIQNTYGNEALAYWTTPNTILTLSGARAVCDGVFWDDEHKGLLEKWQKEIDDSLAVLVQFSSVLLAEAKVQEARPGESYAGYEIILTEGLRYSLQQTDIVPDDLFDQLKTKQNFEELNQCLLDKVRDNKLTAGIDKEGIEHIAAGILLGYPDKAILDSVDKWQEGGPFDEPLIHADIRGADYYLCPQPVYDYPRSLAGDREITAHEKLWSTILKDYYTSDFHKSLEKDPKFLERAKEIGSIS